MKTMAEIGYKAFTSQLVPGQEGTPKCFTPLPWDQLKPWVQEAYLTAAYYVTSYLGLPADDLAQEAYAVHTNILAGTDPGTPRDFFLLARGHRRAWLAFVRVIVSECKAMAN